MALLDDRLQVLLPHFNGLIGVSIQMQDEPMFRSHPEVIAFWRKPHIYVAPDFTDRAKLKYGTNWSTKLDEILIRPLIHAWLESKGGDFFREDVAGMKVGGINEYFLWKAHELGLDMSAEVAKYQILKPYWDMIKIGWNPFGNIVPQMSKIIGLLVDKIQSSFHFEVRLEAEGGGFGFGFVDIQLLEPIEYADTVIITDTSGINPSFQGNATNVKIDKYANFQVAYKRREVRINVSNRECGMSKTITLRQR